MMRRLNVGPRSILAFSIIVAIVIALGVVAIAQMRHLRESEQDVETNSLVSVRQAALMNSALLRIRLESLRGVTTTDPILREQTLNALGNLIQTFTTAIRDYGPLVSSDEERALYLRVQNDATSYSALFDQFEKLFRSGDSAAAVSLINTSIRPLADRLQSQLEGLSALNERDAKAIGVRAAQTYVTGLTWVYGLIATTIFITILMAFVLTKSLTVPIGDALRIAQRIARKDLSEEVVVSGADEAAGLLTALAEMQQNLKQTISHLADSSHQLAAAAEEMTAVIDEGNQGLIQQNDEVNQAATAVTEMSAAVDEVARNAEEAAGASLRTTTLTQSGLKHVAHTLTTIEQLAEAVAGSGEQVQTLSSKAQEISTVVEVIRSIAEQTNLLALNAAIEAARAGDQGRGFAVVADEVRALAHRTQQSTVEIERMIKTIQSDSAQAAQAMLRSTQMANESMGVAKHANGSLVEITDAIATINERNALIATAAEEQAQVAREIDRNITRIKDLSCRSAAGSTQTATASGEVSRLAVGLNQVVNQFVV